ncbi:glycosyltransferase [Candidatus Woesearchaeota archaeon]|nr:glycosyltransferase [Candidatus Woesearchaeota archaeon]
MKEIVLPDTSLCAIVKDELMNPAGGIRDFIETTAPFVERAIILDTGSTDGTFEELEDLRRKHSNLEVVEGSWYNDFGMARNQALEHVETSNVLVLDADERIRKEDFKKLISLLKEKPLGENGLIGYDFGCLNIYYDNVVEVEEDLHNPRLFKKHPMITYFDAVGERLRIGKYLVIKLDGATIDSETNILHFKNDIGLKNAKRDYYTWIDENKIFDPITELIRFIKKEKKIQKPSISKELKAFNPSRELYR